MEKVIVVFDGFCVLCNNYVRWVSKRNPSKNIYFTNFDMEENGLVASRVINLNGKQ